MSNIPEIIFDQVNGPRLIVLNEDGINTSSLYIDASGVIRSAEGTSLSVVSSSVAGTSSYVFYTSIQNLPTLVSSSTQITYTQVTGVPSGIVSSSAQVNSVLPGGVVSSSVQVRDNLPANSVSSSAQITYFSVSGIPANIVSSSAQVILVLPVGVVSSSAQVVNSLSLNTVSSSAQLSNGAAIAFTSSNNVTFGSVTASVAFLGSLVGTASWASTAGTASFVTYDNVANKPTLVSSSVQVRDLLPTNVITSSAQLSNGAAIAFTSSNNVTFGSVTSSLGFLGSLAGTASWATNASSVAYDSVTGKPTIISSSAQIRDNLPANSVSSSAQIAYLSITGISSGIVSSSAQVVSILPSNTVSSSAQLSNGATIAFTSSNNVTFGSVTSSVAFLGTLVGTASWASLARTASFVEYDNVANKPTLISSSAQIIANLPINVVTSSAQLSNGAAIAFTSSNNVTFGSVTASIGFLGTASYAVQALTASYSLQSLTASYVLGTVTLPANVVSSSAQLSNGGGVAFTSSNNVTFGSVTASIDFLGTLVGTSSWASLARTASFVTFDNVSSKPTLISSSIQVIDNLPSNVVSSSAQLSNGGVIAFTSSNNVTFGSVTSSLGFRGTASYATMALTASYALSAVATLPANVVSSSAQLSNGGGTAFTSSNNVTFGSVTASVLLGTASYALQALSASWAPGGTTLPANVVSSSAQMSNGGTVGVAFTSSNNVTFGSVTASLFGTASYALSEIGVVWTGSIAAEANTWRGLTYGNGLFVAVATDGVNRVMTSPDGRNWTGSAASEANSWMGVTYGGGQFVAVAPDGVNQVMTSPDGRNWTARATPSANSWGSVTYGNGLYVAVAYAGGFTDKVMTSRNGINWTTGSIADTNWTRVTYGNGLFVAVAPAGTVTTSPDGITWTSRTPAAALSWNSVTYGNGLFVACSMTGTNNQIMTSHDGITWTSRVTPGLSSWRSVTYGNGIFVAVSAPLADSYIMTSTDGIVWTARAASAATEWYTVSYGNGIFVAAAISGPIRVMSSGKQETNIVPSLSFYGTASYATTAITASYALSATATLPQGVISSSQQVGELLTPTICGFGIAISNFRYL